MLFSTRSRRFLTAAVAFFLSLGAMQAQQVNVTGTVKDTKGEPVAGAYVVLQGTTVGTTADSDGAYSLSVPASGTLVFSSMGYKDQVVAVGGRARIDVTLEVNAEMLDDVVITAMGIKKERKALGYSVTEVNSKELLKNKNTNIINSIAGKVPGVNITQTGGAAGAGSSIIIRGGNSASESRDNQPLFVVDGVIYDNSTINGGNSGTDGVTKGSTTFSNRVMDISPDDIETMSILKGAAAAALYGSRAADGVIVITTKRGKEGSVKVNFNTKYTYSWANKVPEIQNVYGRGYYNQAGSFSDYTTQSWGDKVTGSTYDNVADFFQGGNIFDNNFSVSGGSKNGSFFLSASRYDQQGIVPTTDYDKTTFRFNGDHKYGRLTVGANVAYSIANTDKTLVQSGLYEGGGNGTMTALYGWSRSDDMSHYLNEDGTKYRMFEGLQELADDVENPYWIINKNNLSDRTKRFTGSVHASFDFTKDLSLSYRLGYDQYDADAKTYIAPGGAVKEIYQNGRLNKSNVDFTYYSSNVMLNYHKACGDFDFNFLLGQMAESTEVVRSTHWGWNFQTEGTISFANILDADQRHSEATSRKRMVAGYGEFRGSWKNMLFLTVTGRNDWTSTLPVNNRSYFYPSVSGSFVFTELMPKSDILSFGKVRASWAQVGKDASAYATNTYLWSPQAVNGSFVGIGNNWTGGSPYLVPEIQTSYELGAELKFFNGRLGLDYTYYHSVTDNQIAAPRLAQSTGYIFLTLNSGSVKNYGHELSITGTPVSTRDFNWDVTLNLSRNVGTLGEFLKGVSLFYVTEAQYGGAKAASVPNGGYFLGMTGDYWTRTVGADGEETKDGSYIVDPATGLYKNSKVSTNVVGNREPSLIGGLNNSISYKNFNLSFLFDIRLGGDIYNGTDYYLTMRGLSMKSLDRTSVTVSGVEDTGEKTNGTVLQEDGSYNQVPVYKDVAYTYDADKTYTINGATYSGKYMIQQYWNNYCSNAYNFITKTNWLKLRSLSLSYDFTDLVSKTGFIKGLTANVTGTNLFTWTNYKGMDPEVSVSGSGTGGSGSAGLDYCGVPATAGLSFGLNLTF